MKQKTECLQAFTRRSREAAAILASSFHSALALLLILTIQLTWLPHHVGAQAKPNDKSVEIISILREAAKLAKDKSVVDELAQAEALLATSHTGDPDAAFPSIGARVHKILQNIIDEPRGES